MNRRIACNKEIHAKEKAVELAISVNGKFEFRLFVIM